MSLTVESVIQARTPNPNLFLHLFGGVVFSSGTPNDYFNCGGLPVMKRRIYAVEFEAMSDPVFQAQ
jgi:hypothetical protein